MKKIILLLPPLLLCRCSTLETSIGVGAGLGAGTGFTASKLARYNTRGTVVLTASGVLIGAALGAVLHRAPDAIPPAALNGNPPPLRNAETDVLWVPDSLQDGKYVEGHRVWSIRSPAHWQLTDENKGKKNGEGTQAEEKK